MKSIVRLAFACLVLSAFAPAQSIGPKKITSTECVEIGALSEATVSISVGGTWTGTLQPEATIQGQAAFNVTVTPAASTTAQATITANGAYRVSVAGYSTFQLCGSTVASGTAVVYLNATDAGMGASGGGSAPVTLETNGAANTDQTTLNFQTSTANTVGLTVTPSNPSAGNEKFEVTGSYSPSVPFSQVGAGTDLVALLIGTGGSLGVSGTGTITATSMPGISVNTTSPLTGGGALSGSLTLACPNCNTGNIEAAQYGVVPGFSVVDASITSTSTTVTCPNSNCNFDSTMIGWIVFGVVGANTNGNGVVRLPQGTIASINSPQSIEVSNAATATSTGNVWLTWGPDNSTAFTNAWNAVNSTCQTLHIAAGYFLVQSAQFNTENGTTCGVNNPAFAAPGLFGSGIASTFIVPTPNFNFATCSAGPGNKTCFFGAQWENVYQLAVSGNGNPGSGTHAVNLTAVNGARFVNVNLASWCTACAGSTGIAISGIQAGAMQGGANLFGETGCSTNGSNEIMQQWTCTNGNLHILGGSLVSTATGFGPGLGGLPSLLIDSGGEMFSYGDFLQGTGTNFGATVNGTLHANGTLLVNTGATRNIALNVGTTGKVYATDAKFQGGATGAWLQLANGGIFVDEGVNILTGTAAPLVPAFGQAPTGASGSGTSIVKAVTATLNAYALVLVAWQTATPNLTGCTDTLTNTIAQVGTTQTTTSVHGAVLSFAVLQIEKVKTGGADTITCTFDAGTSYNAINYVEYTGQIQSGTVIDTSQTGSGSTTAVSIGPVTTNGPGEQIILVGAGNAAGLNCAASATGSVTRLAGALAPFAIEEAAYLSGASTYTISCTLGAAKDWVATAITFKPPAISGYFRSASATGVAQTAANWSTPAGAGAGQWGTSPSVASCTGDSQVQTCTITVGSGTVGANPVLTITQPTGFQIPPMCAAHMVGGTATYSNILTGTVTTTTAAFTYNGTPAASSTMTLKVSCSN
jgi:hypothetical protein